MNLHKLNDTTKVIPIFMADATTPTAGKTGLTLTITLSKNGGPFVAAAGTVSEVGSGFYSFTPTSVDVGTMGPMIVLATATGAINFAASYRVVAFDPYSASNLGLSSLPNSGTLAVKPSVTLAATDVAGNLPANTVQLAGQTVSAVSSVAFPASVGTSTYAGADTSGTTMLLSRVTGPVALASQVPANFTAATFASAGVFATSALANAPTGGGTVGSGTDPWAIVLPGNYATGTAGALLGTNLDAKVSSRSIFAGGAVAAVTAPVTVGGYASGQDPATLVLDTTAANHSLANSIGALINSPITPTFATTGDPWTASLPGTYAAGTAGSILGGWVNAIGQLLPTGFKSLAIDSTTGGVTTVMNMDKSGYLLAPNGLDAVPVETNVNVRQALSPILAAAAGVVSGAGTGTILIKGGNVTDTRIKATTDKSGNRTAVTLTFPTSIIVSPGNIASYFFPTAYFPTPYFPIGKAEPQSAPTS